MKLTRRLAIATCGLLGVMLMSQPSDAQKENPDRVRGSLNALAQDENAWKTFRVTCDNLHTLHGGLKLTFHGDGRIEQRSSREEVGVPKPSVSRADLQRLVALLIELAAWEQRVPARRPGKDEPRAFVRITLDGNKSVIWEWTADLEKHQRIVRVLQLMKEIAWK